MSAPRANPRQRDRQSAYTGKWRRTRARYLRLFPGCEVDGCQRGAVDVHHLDGKGPLGPRGHDFGNLQALCRPHHSRETASRQAKRTRPTGEHPGLIEG